jgi:hypothetical protein
MAMAALLALGSQAEKRPAPTPPVDMKPAVSIEVAPLGYKAPGTFYLTYRLTSATMGFFDDDHLLFTFRVGDCWRGRRTIGRKTTTSRYGRWCWICGREK